MLIAVLKNKYVDNFRHAFVPYEQIYRAPAPGNKSEALAQVDWTVIVD